MSSSTDRSARKPYETPKLFVYGDIREITKSVSNTSNVDDTGTGKTNKTH
jgi:hypothetical protein